MIIFFSIFINKIRLLKKRNMFSVNIVKNNNIYKEFFIFKLIIILIPLNIKNSQKNFYIISLKMMIFLFHFSLNIKRLLNSETAFLLILYKKTISLRKLFIFKLIIILLRKI